MAEKIRNIEVRDVECDELWSFIAKTQKRIRPEDDQNLGDAYTFVAIERHTKLVLNIALGKRDQHTTNAFVEGIRHATSSSAFQITTDGFSPYRTAITTTLHDRCDYAALIKVYRSSQDGEARYSPAEVASTEVVPVMGQPDPERICTSIVERSNLTTRMSNRRFTRLTNAFSKKWENHWASVACWFAFYNVCRVHKSLRTTPAMAAGITNHVWSVRELLEVARSASDAIHRGLGHPHIRERRLPPTRYPRVLKSNAHQSIIVRRTKTGRRVPRRDRALHGCCRRAFAESGDYDDRGLREAVEYCRRCQK
jgi:IS1 family transposase